MPTRTPRFNPPTQRTKQERKRDADRSRYNAPWRAWYGAARWVAIRQTQLSEHPLCAMCIEVEDVTAANVCDHVTPHRGDETLFWSGPFQSLCEACHNGRKQREERAQSSRVNINDINALLD